MAFQCDIVTPDHEVFSQSVEGVTLPAHDGQMGILTHRAPLLVKLGLGPMTCHLQGGDRVFYIEGGVAQMKDNKLTVLTDAALPSDQLNHAAAQEELAAAEQLPMADEDAYNQRQKAVARARAKMAMTA